jgi:hypothetical protein
MGMPFACRMSRVDVIDRDTEAVIRSADDEHFLGH